MNDTDFRRVHPLTPLLHAWALIAAVVATSLANIGAQDLREAPGFVGQLGPLALVAAIAAIPALLGMFWLLFLPWWRATGYQVGPEEIAVRHGVVTKSLRTARFDRIHAVDIVEPLLPRLCGLVAVRVETAGGHDSVLSIEFLRRKGAEELRRELLAAKSKVTGTAIDANSESPLTEASSAEAVSDTTTIDGNSDSSAVTVPPVPASRSLMAAALTLSTIIGAVFLALFVFSPLGVAMVAPLIGIAPQVWSVINRSWRFTARRNNDVLDVTFGLTERRQQSIRLDRIHAVKLTQPFLWRWAGWWKVDADIAGYGELDATSGTTTLLPVGSKNTALAVLREVGPLNAAEIEYFANPSRAQHADYSSPSAARWVSPIDWRQQAVTLVRRGTPEAAHAVITHDGRINRKMCVVATRHIQELTMTYGPMTTLLGLANVRMDLVTGPVTMSGEDMMRNDSHSLVTELRRRQLPSEIDGLHRQG